MPRSVAEADVLDGLVLELYLWWLAAESEWWLLERAKKLGIAPSRMGPLLGVASRQGVHGRLRLARGKIARLRGAPLHPPTAPSSEQAAQQAQARWLAQHRAEIRGIAGDAVSLRDVVGDPAAEWLVEVARDLADDRALTRPSFFQLLRFALDEVEADAACEQGASRQLRDDLLRRWAELYSRYPRAAPSR